MKFKRQTNRQNLIQKNLKIQKNASEDKPINHKRGRQNMIQQTKQPKEIWINCKCEEIFPFTKFTLLYLRKGDQP